MGIAPKAVAAGLVLSLALGAAYADTPAPAPARPNALVECPARDGRTLTVTTPAFANGGMIPFANTQYRTNTFPGFAWTAGPAGTRSYVLIMQDTDIVYRGLPILHWSLYNIPANVTAMDPGMAPDGQPAGASYGPNYRGRDQPYLGPRTPPGQKDHYHFQVFALDTTVPADPAITYDTLTSAMKGHVLASGEVVGIGEAEPSAPPPAPRPGPRTP